MAEQRDPRNETQPKETPAWAPSDTMVFDDHTAEVQTVKEEEYDHPFFDLPPLERTRKKLKKDKPNRANETRGIELWKVLLAVLVCMLFAMGSYLVGKVYAVALIPDEPAFILPPSEEDPIEPEEMEQAPPILTLLVLGTDQRDKYEKGRADTIILATLNLDTRDINMISIPRDTRTLIADTTSTTRINHAHATGGPERTVKTVENLLGINVHYYIEMNFQGFVNCIDILGGVDYNVERRMLFIEEGIDLHPGQQRLDGDKALQYVRWRGDPTADIGRVGRQQTFVRAMLEQSMSLSTVARVPTLISELKANVVTDMNTAQMINLGVRFADIRNLSFNSVTLPGEARTIGGGAYWVMDEAAVKELIMSIYEPPAPTPVETVEEPDEEKSGINGE